MSQEKTPRLLLKWEGHTPVYQATAMQYTELSDDSHYELVGYAMFPKYEQLEDERKLKKFKERVREIGDDVVFLDEIEEEEETKIKDSEWNKRVKEKMDNEMKKNSLLEQCIYLEKEVKMLMMMFSNVRDRVEKLEENLDRGE